MIARKPISIDPIHAILSAFPVALFISALATDVTYYQSAQIQWANMSAWLLVGGLVFGGIALLDGVTNAWRTRATRSRRGRSVTHVAVSVAFWVLALIDTLVHTHDGWTSVVPLGIVLSAIVALLALIASWRGYSIFVREDR